MMFRKWIYGILAVIGIVVLILVDMTMVVPFSTNPIVASALVLIIDLFLLYLLYFVRCFEQNQTSI